MRYKISPVGSLHWSQSTRVTDGRTDGQNYDSQDRASIAASRGKNDLPHVHIGIASQLLFNQALCTSTGTVEY